MRRARAFRKGQLHITSTVPIPIDWYREKRRMRFDTYLEFIIIPSTLNVVL